MSNLSSKNPERKQIVFSFTCWSATHLAKFYNMDIRTFKKRLAPYRGIIGPQVGKKFSINQVHTITKLMDGVPKTTIWL